MKRYHIFDKAVETAYSYANKKYSIEYGFKFGFDIRNKLIDEYVKEYVNRHVWVCIETGDMVTVAEKIFLLEANYDFDEFTPMSEQYNYFLPVFDYVEIYGEEEEDTEETGGEGTDDTIESWIMENSPYERF